LAWNIFPNPGIDNAKIAGIAAVINVNPKAVGIKVSAPLRTLPSDIAFKPAANPLRKFLILSPALPVIPFVLSAAAPAPSPALSATSFVLSEAPEKKSLIFPPASCNPPFLNNPKKFRS